MKTLYSSAIGCMAVACVAMTGNANAADMEYERAMELVVSGVVEYWNGYSFVSGYSPPIQIRQTYCRMTVTSFPVPVGA